MTHIITSFFQSNIAKRYSRMIFRSLFPSLLGKSANAMISTLRKLVMMEIISICSPASHRSGVAQKLFASLNLLLPNSSFLNFPSSRKNYGAESSGQTVSILQRLASGVTGPQSSGMWQTKEKRLVRHDSYVYSLRTSLGSYLVGSAPR